MKKSVVGVVGAGAFTQFCLEAYQQYLPEVEVLAITDLNLAQANSVAKQFQIQSVVESSTELFQLNVLDAVIVLTPPNTHFQLAREALVNNKNVLVEKPIAFTEDEARSLIELAESRHRQLTANLILRFHPFHQQLRQIVRQGSLGSLREIMTQAEMAKYPPNHWYWDEKISGGFFLNTYCHFVDLYNYITDESPIRYACQQKTGHAHQIELEFANTRVSLRTNLDVSNDEESVETKYIFDRGEVTTFGWLPERMVISSQNKTQEFNETLPKTTRYQQLLASVLKDLLVRVTKPDSPSVINHQILLETVRQPLRLARELNSN